MGDVDLRAGAPSASHQDRLASDGSGQRRPPPDMIAALRRMELLAADARTPDGEALAGGVSSEIWRIDLPGRPICLKRALPRLRVAAVWEAPVDRNTFEARWMRWAARAAPGSAPDLLGHDPEAGCLAMAYLPPSAYPLWKSELRAGRADPAFAAAVGARLAQIHAATARSAAAVIADFPDLTIFEAIRIEPYLRAAARAHPDHAAALAHLATTVMTTRLALVHGDVSPKNILCGPGGPVFLDAECACWADPAFDVAFCLNHLLLKCLWVPAFTAGFLDCFAALASCYGANVNWEPVAEVEARAARLIPGLLLARIDGKSPVEYVVSTFARQRVRSAAGAMLAVPPRDLTSVANIWRNELAGL